MSFSIKTILFTALMVLTWETSCLGQVEFRVGTFYPVPNGNNFLNEAYEYNFGVSTEFNFPIHENWFGQIAYSFFHARVTKPELVGVIVRTGVTHVHGAVGYQAIINPKFEMDVKLGAGPALYRHFQDDDMFYDDGTSIIIGADFLYMITKGRRDFVWS